MFTLNEEPCQFAICAGQIKTVPGGAWPWHFGPQLHDFIITLLTYHFLRKCNKMFVFFIVGEVEKKKPSTIKHRNTLLPTQAGACLKLIPVLAVIVWVTVEERKRPCLWWFFSNREQSPRMTTALLGIWSVLLSRKADN